MVSRILKWRKVWPIGDPQAAVFAGIGMRKNSSNGMTTGVDACTTDSIGGIAVGPTEGLQFSEDPLLVFDGAPPVDTLADALQSMNDAGLDWAAILAGNFTYTISNKAQFPDFSTLPTDFYPSILFTGSRLDVRGPEFNGRGLLVVVEELRMNNDWVWDGAIMVGNYFQSNGKMTITGSLSSGLDIQLGRDPATMKISAIGPGEAQVTYDSCILAKAVGAVGAGAKQLVVLDGTWVAGW